MILKKNLFRLDTNYAPSFILTLFTGVALLYLQGWTKESLLLKVSRSGEIVRRPTFNGLPTSQIRTSKCPSTTEKIGKRKERRTCDLGEPTGRRSGD